MPARAGILRKIAHARPPPAPQPGPARGARTRPSIRKPARASLAFFLPPGQLNSQALHPVADSRLDGSEGNLQAAGDLLLSVSAVIGQHDGFTLFRREGHQGAAYRRAFDAAEGLLHHVGAAACAAITFGQRFHGTNSLAAQRVDGAVMGQGQYPGTGAATRREKFTGAAPDVEEDLLCDFLGGLWIAKHS